MNKESESEIKKGAVFWLRQDTTRAVKMPHASPTPLDPHPAARTRSELCSWAPGRRVGSPSCATSELSSSRFRAASLDSHILKQRNGPRHSSAQGSEIVFTTRRMGRVLR